MKVGLAKADITPRIGVELQGYGPYLCRHSDGVRDRLYARAIAFDAGGERAVLVSCDLAGVPEYLVQRVREIVRAQTGVLESSIMVHAIHTHSGPAVRIYTGWGTVDPPYVEILPYRIADACCRALAGLQEATLLHAEVPCRGVAINRETDAFRVEKIEDALEDDWQPDKPEETDTTCHVVKVEAGDRMIGFVSYYGCHPVIGGANTRKIHGDWAGVATNLVQRLHPGSVGLFLQGAQGDVNSCVVCHEEAEALRALDVIAARYARSIMDGLAQATPVEANVLRSVRHATRFSRKPWGRERLQSLLSEREDVLHAREANDADQRLRQAMVCAQALRGMLQRLYAGEDLSPEIELQGLRIGPIVLLGSPFETFRAIKNEVVAAARSPIPLVMSFVNGSVGYAVDRQAAEKGGYAVDLAPFIHGQLPFAAIHDELVQALLTLDRELV